MRLQPWRSRVVSRAPGAATWSGRDLRREVFTFKCGEFDLYGSLYSPSAGAPFGVVVCPPWGAEARTGERLCRLLALGVARRGGAAVVFDWPGQGESTGDPGRVEMQHLARAVAAAASEVRARAGVDEITLAGLRVGAAIAVLAAGELDAGSLALLQPVWDPDEHFASVRRASSRASLGRGAGGLAFGFPFPSLTGFAGSGEAVRHGLGAYKGPVAAFGYGDGTPPADVQVESHAVPGEWRQAATTGDSRVMDAAVAWIDSKTGTR